MNWQSVINGERKWSVDCADCLTWLRGLPDACVNCCVTSPPYWGLRDYGTAKWEGGDENCNHKDDRQARRNLNHSASEQRQGRTADEGKLRDGIGSVQHSCRCGAVRIDNQLGLERTPDEYVAKMVEVFREVRRVLAKDGTLWLNLGDSYQAGKGQSGGVDLKQPARRHLRCARPNDKPIIGLKSKDLVGIPWMVAFALRADGWYLRQDLIWSKPNPMPESVTDRCTKAHEYIFLLSKSRRYYYNADAIAEPVAESTIQRLCQDIENQNGSPVPGKTNGNMKAVFGGRKKHAGYGTRIHSGREDSGSYLERGANKRSVWTIAPQPDSAAHFATFPDALVKPCILAGCKPNGIVMDPFAGTGTTLRVAVELGCRAIGCDLNPEYVGTLAIPRLKSTTPGMFA